MGQRASKINSESESKKEIEIPVIQNEILSDHTSQMQARITIEQQMKQLHQQLELVDRYSKDVPTSKAQIQWMIDIDTKYREPVEVGLLYENETGIKVPFKLSQ